jgi:hypothetical protein
VLFNCWQFITRHPGILLVFLGVVGEIIFDWADMKGRQAWGKRLSAFILIGGLLLEFAEAAKSDKEVALANQRAVANELQVAELKKENLVLHSNVFELEKQIIDATNSVAQIDPFNQPVSDVSALVKIVVAGETFPNITTSRSKSLDAVSVIMLCESNITWSLFDVLIADGFIAETNNNDAGTRAYLLKFHSFDKGAIYMADGNPPVANAIKKVNLLRIDNWFLPHDSKVLGGNVLLVINSTIRQSFQIPAQKDLNPMNNTLGDGFIIVATNSISGNPVPNVRK